MVNETAEVEVKNGLTFAQDVLGRSIPLFTVLTVERIDLFLLTQEISVIISNKRPIENGAAPVLKQPTELVLFPSIKKESAAEDRDMQDTILIIVSSARLRFMDNVQTTYLPFLPVTEFSLRRKINLYRSPEKLENVAYVRWFGISIQVLPGPPTSVEFCTSAAAG